MPLMSRGSVAAVRRGSGAVVRRGEPGRASWYPEAAIPATLARLDAVEALVPEELRDLYAQFRQTALTVQAGLSSLPRGMVHGDAWPGNAVQSGPDTVTLIDWETGGLGLPVLDLGTCLIESLLDAQPSGSRSPGWVSGSGSAVPRSGVAAWLVEPDEDRIAAVAAGIRVAARGGCGRARPAARGGPVRCVLRGGHPPVSGPGRRGARRVDGGAAGTVAEPGVGERGRGPPGRPSSRGRRRTRGRRRLRGRPRPRGRRRNGTLRPVACWQ